MALLPLTAQTGGNTVAQCPMVKIQAERIADLNIPRHGHSVLNVNGKPTVFGGHTTNFVPTPTLEYYKGGKWHLVQTAFTHDDGCAVQLSTGKVLIVGGHEKNLGIGQSFEAELYDPQSHTCQGFASLDTKRAKPSALALDDDRVVIAGNWYHKDAIEMYDGKGQFLPVKDVAVGRCTPHILRIARDDAIIVGGGDTIGRQITLPVVDRLRGEPYHVPLLETWRFLRNDRYWPASHCFIGDEAKEDYSYLIPVFSDQGEIAIARVTNGEFSLLPTDVPIPKSFQRDSIHYLNSIIADRQHRRAYLIGGDTDFLLETDSLHLYVLAIDYAVSPAHLTCFYTDVHPDMDSQNALLTEDGDLMMIGGLPTSSNFLPTAAVWLLHVGPNTPKAGLGKYLNRLPLWGWILIALLAAALVAWLIWRGASRRRVGPRLGVAADDVATDVVTANGVATNEGSEGQVLTDGGENTAELMRRICQLMEERQLYLNPDLKATDVAQALGTTRIVLSNCIRANRNCTFPQFVNTYRVTHAQELMRTQRELKITEVYISSGFSSEASFYRIFKSITGNTPNEWRNNNL